MKSFRNILVLAMLAMFVMNCKNEAKPEVKTVDVEVATEDKTEAKELDPNATYAKAEFTIKGMTCAMGCAKTIEKKLGKMEGVKSASVDFEKELAMVVYNEAKVTPEALEETVTKVGDAYSVEGMKTVDGFSDKKTCSPDCKKACCAGKDKKTCSVKCSPDCDVEDCPKCAAKTAECKKKCEAKKAKADVEGTAKEGKKMACKPDCKMACCAEKGKA